MAFYLEIKMHYKQTTREEWEKSKTKEHTATKELDSLIELHWSLCVCLFSPNALLYLCQWKQQYQFWCFKVKLTIFVRVATRERSRNTCVFLLQGRGIWAYMLKTSYTEVFWLAKLAPSKEDFWFCKVSSADPSISRQTGTEVVLVSKNPKPTCQKP